MTMAKLMAKLKGLFRSNNMVGIDKTGNRYFTRTEDIDGAFEWISWLTGRRKVAPTAQEMLDLEGQRKQVKMNAAILQKEEEKMSFRAKSLQQSMNNDDVGPPNLERFIQQFSDISVAYNEGDDTQPISHETHKDTDGFRSSEPKGTGQPFQPGTWQPPK